MTEQVNLQKQVPPKLGSQHSSKTKNNQETPGEEFSIPENSTPRERILMAAIKLFVEKGYFNTNVPDISKLSKCSVGSIYHHFLNKEEIASELYLQGIKQFREALAKTISLDDKIDDVIRNLVETFITFAKTHQLISRYLWLVRHDEFLSQRVGRPTMVGFDDLGRKLTKMIKAGKRSGALPKVKADVIWSIVFGMPMSYITDWLEGYSRKEPSEAAPIFAHAAVCALQGLKSLEN